MENKRAQQDILKLENMLVSDHHKKQNITSSDKRVTQNIYYDNRIKTPQKTGTLKKFGFLQLDLVKALFLYEARKVCLAFIYFWREVLFVQHKNIAPNRTGRHNSEDQDKSLETDSKELESMNFLKYNSKSSHRCSCLIPQRNYKTTTQIGN